MKKIKVGYLPLYIKLYDDSNPHYRDPMVDYMHMLIKMLESQGLEVVLADEVCRIKPEFDRAAKKFNDAGVSAVITQDRKSTRLNSSHSGESRMPSSA